MKDLIFCDSLSECLQRIENECLKMPTLENCGFLGYNPRHKSFVVAICDNKCNKPHESFLISPYDHLDFLIRNKIIAVYHNHLKESTPSAYDNLGCRNTCLPYLIYGAGDNNFSLILPKILDKKSSYLKGIKDLKSIIIHDYEQGKVYR
mgnify:CR=1 FL=1|jgi:hypothetical protein